MLLNQFHLVKQWHGSCTSVLSCDPQRGACLSGRRENSQASEKYMHPNMNYRKLIAFLNVFYKETSVTL